MPYRLSPDDKTLRHALRRLARSELGAALAHVSDGPMTPAGVHDIRKRIKKLRGALRLVRPGFAAFKPENAALRDAARALASARDAEVRLATLDGVFPTLPPPLQPFRDHLSHLRDSPRQDDQTEVAAALRNLQARALHWRVEGKDAEVLAQGLATTRRRAQAAMAAARRHPALDPMHDWRKRAKDYWYQTRLLTPIWPEAMRPLSQAASALTEGLGQHHDLGVLAESAPEGLLDAEATALLAQAVAEAQQGIEAQVFPLGARLFAGDPEDVAKLWVSWWRIWRDEG